MRRTSTRLSLRPAYPSWASATEYGYAKIQVNKTGHALADKLFEGIEMEEDGGLQVRAVHH
jgi:hypothetical protein